MDQDGWLSCVAFLVCRGQKLEDLMKAGYIEKLFYIESVNKYIEFESKKMGGG